MIRGALVLLTACSVAHAAPKEDLTPEDVAHCGAPPPADATWFYLGDPRPSAAVAAHRVLRALHESLDGVLPRDPACLHVEIPETFEELAARNKKLHKRALDGNVVGFHTAKLGASDTVFANPSPGQGLDIVLLHEVLHAESHRFSLEASRHRVNKLVEGATEYMTRELAEISLGIPRAKFRSGYQPYLAFYDRLMKRLGKLGPRQLSTAYFREGYDAFENFVDRELDINLRTAGHALESEDFETAYQQLE